MYVWTRGDNTTVKICKNGHTTGWYKDRQCIGCRREYDNRKYATDEKWRNRKKASRITQVATGKWSRPNKEVARLAYNRAVVEKKTYLAELFAPSADKRIIVKDVSRVAILSDLQIPFEDTGAVQQALNVVNNIDADLVILNGDIIDCYAESDFLKNETLAAKTISETHKRLRNLLDCLTPRRVIYLAGNHEDRWRRVLWAQNKRPGVLSIIKAHQEATGQPVDMNDPDVSFAKLYGLTERGIPYYPYSHRLYLAEQNLIVTHGKHVSRHSGQSAKRTFEWLGTSCIVGHTHRLGTYLTTQDGVMHGAWENGCLCQLEPEYDDAPNWQQGMSIVKINGPEFHVIQVPIIRREGKAVAVLENLNAPE